MIFLGDKRSIYFFAVVALTLIFAGCDSSDQKASAPKQMYSAQKVQLTQPFRFHKTVEVSPENTFDIFSWGRGSAETSALLILESDSSSKKYTTTTGDLEGAITDVYNTDMDMDGNPEILIQAKAKDSTVHTQIYAFEFKDNRAQKIDFPKLNQSQKKGYRGQDKFFIKEGILMREFPVYNGNNTDAKPTGGKRLLEYGIRSNSFTVKIIEQGNEHETLAASDSTKKSTSVSSNTSEKNTSQKKHHISERHRTRKRERKNSNHSGKKHRRHRR